ncbi:MAG: tryptophan synthase subunit alpha [Fervidobacterium sp.]|nr:tryptophan synthase subunit alpha [Fervidobacterium sp.]
MTKNKINELFNQKEKLLIPYITAGDPTFKSSLQLLNFLASNKAKAIEIGIPFSDPMADGEIIQRAMNRALGFSISKTFELIEKFRTKHNTPIILMGYFNTFYNYGIKKLAEKMNELDIEAIIIVDLPLEEVDIIFEIFRKHNIHLIPLISPITPIERLEKMKTFFSGFAYLISITGTTGIRNTLPQNIKLRAKIVKEKTGLPTLLGFGVSNPQIIEEFKDEVDGFIIGSALIKSWEEDNFSIGENLKKFWQSMISKVHTY